MKILDRFRNRKAVERLIQAVQQSPSVANYITLIRKCEELNDMTGALTFAQEAIDVFPDSEEIFSVYYRLKKRQVQPEIAALKKVIQERPNPNAYTQLAEIYKDFREEEMALKYCRQCIEKFPKVDGPYLIIGELRYRRFIKGILVNDGRMAMENLEEAYEINRKNYKALLLLAKFYLQIGAISKAIARLKSILLFAPEDDSAQKLLDAALKVPKPSHEDIDLLLQTAEAERKLYFPLEDKHPQQASLPKISPEIFTAHLEKTLPLVNGHLATFVCDEEGHMIAHCVREGNDPNIFYDIATTIYSTARDSSRQMDLGRLQRGIIEGPFGSVNIITADGYTYITFGNTEVKAGTLVQKLEGIISQLGVAAKKGS